MSEFTPKRIRRATSALVGLAILSACANSSSKAPTPKPAPITVESPATAESPAEAAQTISAELYDNKNFPRGVPVPGVLNAVIETDIKGTDGVNHPGYYVNPVLLEQPKSATDFNGAWIGIPGSNAEGHVVLTPVQIELGPSENGDTTVAMSKYDSKEPLLLEGAAVYPTKVTNQPDELFAFDMTGNGNFNSVRSESAGMK